jgi:transposase
LWGFSKQATRGWRRNILEEAAPLTQDERPAFAQVGGGKLPREEGAVRDADPVYRGADENTIDASKGTPLTMTTVKALLNFAQPIPGFVYDKVEFDSEGEGRLDVAVRAHELIRPCCCHCRKPCPGYDQLPGRRWRGVSLWNIILWIYYAPRRVECRQHGVVVEYMPWSDGKRPWTVGMMAFLALWAQRLSWRDTARAFGVSWEAVFRSVEWTVEWGLKHRVLEGIRSIGVDELHWSRRKKGDGFLTVIYQIDAGMRRLLWVGPGRRESTLRAGLDALGAEVIAGLEFVCSDMWKPYLKVIRERIAHALHILDRFHITSHLNQAVDQVRRREMARLRQQAPARASLLKRMRWSLLKKRSRVRGRARQRLDALIASKLPTARAHLLKEAFQHFWTYRSHRHALRFLEAWCQRAMRSRIEPMKKVARMLRRHQPLILNWFLAKGELSSAAVEGMNNKVRVITRRAYGFRTFRALEVALYHNLAHLPKPPRTHKFC